jgi:hypothetical protein
VSNLSGTVSITCCGSTMANADCSNCSTKAKGLDPIDEEFDSLPYACNGFEGDSDWLLEPRQFAMVVFIQNFFTDGRDFAYYVIGQPNVSAFCSGMFGMQAYNGPILATPILYNKNVLAESYDRVRWSDSHMEKVKWKYLFETARMAWHELLIDPQKVEGIRAKNARILRLESNQGDRNPSAD